MGANFISYCHKCKVRLFHLRRPEDIGRTLTKFYKDHYECGQQNYTSVQTIWDYFDTNAFEYAEENYKDVFPEYYPVGGASV